MEFVRRGPGFIKDFEGSNMFVVELLLWLWKVEVHRIEPYTIANLVVARCALPFVILLLHLFGGFFEGILGFFMDVGHVFHELGGGRIGEWGCSRRVREDSWMSAIENHERTFSCGAMYSVIVSELCKR